jgi:hypothetical protein
VERRGDGREEGRIVKWNGCTGYRQADRVLFQFGRQTESEFKTSKLFILVKFWFGMGDVLYFDVMGGVRCEV